MQHGRLANIVFLAIAFALLLSVVGTKLPEEAGVAFPEWTGVGKHESVLEGRKYAARPKAGLDSVLEGRFQSQADKYLADLVPMRDDVLLANAKVQRSVIEAANVPFGFEAYHTFFGSGYCYYPSAGAVLHVPFTRKEYSAKRLSGAARVYAELMLKHRDINWQFALPDSAQCSSCLPTSGLVNDDADYEWIRRHLLDNLPSSCTVQAFSYSDVDSFFNSYYRTDHHWRTPAAADAYCAIVNAFGKSPVIIDGFFECYSGPYWGWRARSGLCAEGQGDAMHDVLFNQGTIIVAVNGKEVVPEALGGSGGEHRLFYEKKSMFSSVYSDYFHGDHGLIVIQSDSVKEGELLIVGDSFTDCIERLFATNYRVVHVIDPRYYDDGTIDDYINEHDIDDAIFLQGITSALSPAFLESLS